MMSVDLGVYIVCVCAVHYLSVGRGELVVNGDRCLWKSHMITVVYW